MVEHVAGNFTGGNVKLDGQSFRNCTFDGVVLDYAGGPILMHDCRLNDVVWNLTGDLRRGLVFLYKLLGKDGAVALVAQVLSEPTTH